MQITLKKKIFVDIIMLTVLLLSMAYLLVGINVHEWIGTAMFGLCIVHNIFNWRWYRNLFRGSYTGMRILQTVINFALLISISALFVSGMIFASYAPDFLRTAETISIARPLHMLGAYWSFVLMSLHLGLHWQMIVNLLKKVAICRQLIAKKVFNIIIWGVACYGIIAFVKHELFAYLFMQNEFAFFDSTQSLGRFLVDYLAMIVLGGGCIYFVNRFILHFAKLKNKKKSQKNLVNNRVYQGE